ncbi:MAG TPA: TetR/AcrR family transcriptional regulator [Streptosporangiaceae bacterium]|nr:TetR/AcrR family transcriptional regulator [Streptosporangiaceae bacterium]
MTGAEAEPATATAPRLTPRVREIVATALALLEEHGAEALTMRRLAERLGIRAPSLYKHLSGKDELETAVIAVGFEDLAAALEQAAARGDRGRGAGQRLAGQRPGGQRLAGLGAAYREFALGRPHLYRLMNERPLNRDQLPPGVEDRAAAPLVAAVGGGPDLARAAWAFAHGMIMLELNQRFPPGADLDAAWRAGLAAVAAVAVAG